MRVLIVSAVFPPEPVVSARLSRDLQLALLARGHGVQVLCPVPSRGARREPSAEPVEAEAGVVRLKSYHCARSRFIGRARESWHFGRRVAKWIGQLSPKAYDVAYANVWPLFGQYHVVKAARAQGISVVLHVQDVYPESLVTKLPGWVYSLAAPRLITLDRAIAGNCQAVVLLSDRIGRRYGQLREVAERVHVVRNWVDQEPFERSYGRETVCAEYGVPPNLFTYMYLGNLSPLAGLQDVIRAFAQFGDSQSQFVIVGEGSAKSGCERLVREAGLANVLFRSDLEASNVARIQAMADVFILPTRKGGAASSTPSKCISYLLSAKPILAAVDSESDVADDLLAADCAWLCPPEDVGALAMAMATARMCTARERQEMGNRGRSYAVAQFSRDSCVRQLTEIVEGSAK